jgi:hypothetical protein
MITKNDILESIRHESNVCKHLAGKLTEGSLEYRPTPGQRSTLELLRYLSVAGIAATRSMVAKDWSIWGTYKPRAEAMTAEEFPALMDQQMEELTAFLDTIDDEAFHTQIVKLPTGHEMPVDAGLVNSVLKWFAAYKMQLFLYAKSTGSENITTYDCWAGIDTPPRQKPAEVPADEAVA